MIFLFGLEGAVSFPFLEGCRLRLSKLLVTLGLS